MKAIVYNEYGTSKVLQLKEVAKPAPKENEILIRIKATAVNSGDVRLRKADPFAVRFVFGLLKPRIHILGSVFSGEIESVGDKVQLFKIGDQVFGHTDMHFGAYAEYISVPQDGSLALKPATISHKEAASIPFGGVTALYFLKKAMIKQNQKVLIVGASGAVGSAAVQLAKSLGAIVTAVCSTANIGMAKSIGADNIIDYTTEDFTKKGEIYDVIFDTVNTISVRRSLKLLSRNGIMILSAAGLSEMLQGAWANFSTKRKVITGVIHHKADDIIKLKGLVEAKKFKPIVDRTYLLEHVAEAHEYVEKGHKKGNVAIEV